MAIGMAQQKGDMVYVYDENNRYMRSVSGELQGYTANTLTIKKGNSLHVYDDKGNFKTSYNC